MDEHERLFTPEFADWIERGRRFPNIVEDRVGNMTFLWPILDAGRNRTPDTGTLVELPEGEVFASILGLAFLGRFETPQIAWKRWQVLKTDYPFDWMDCDGIP